MKVAILSVGTELIFGQTVNTNATYLSQQLNLLGFDVLYHYTMGDNPGRLKRILDIAYEDCQMIITTGGLGPTEDDLTKEIICQYFDDELVQNEESLSLLKAYYQQMNRTMTDNNLKQTVLPSKAIPLQNHAGTAPGFWLEDKGKIIISLPGPPREMKKMFLDEVIPRLKSLVKDFLYYKTIRTFGKGESSLETEIIDLVHNQTNPTVATYAKEGECSVRVCAKGSSMEAAELACKRVIDEIKNRLGEYIYSYDDEDLVQVVGRKLIERSISISSAESCTGGMFAERLTEISGISKVFDRSFVTYSWDAKEQVLGVKRETLENYSAVSSQVALEMVKGLYNITGSDICIAITGVAGPLPDGDNPVGLMYIGVSYKGEIFVEKFQMRNIDRKWNRNYAVLKMLDTVNKLL